MKTFILSILAIAASTVTHAQTFSVQDPLGGMVSFTADGMPSYIGYFCIDRGTEQQLQEKQKTCLKSQFGMGNELLVGVDFLGNPSKALGTWKAIGPVFDASTGNAFYQTALASESKREFIEVWQTIWKREGYNWANTPVEVSKKTFNAFLGLLQPGSIASAKPMTEKQIAKLLDGSLWNIGEWAGWVKFEKVRARLMMTLQIQNRGGRSSGYDYGTAWITDNNNEFSYDLASQCFEGIGQRKDRFKVCVKNEGGNPQVSIDLIIPSGSVYRDSEGTKRYSSREAQEHIELTR